MPDTTRYSLVAALVLGCAYLAATNSFAVEQGEVMECSPPKFMLVSTVDLDAGTLVGMSTVERLAPSPVVSAYHRTLKLADITVTNARRELAAKDSIKELEGKLVVVCDGATPLTAAYLSLFQEDTLVITVKR